MTPEELQSLLDLAERANKAAPGGWYTVGQPWLPRDTNTYVIAGHNDPHVGVPVCDFSDAAMWGVEDRYEDDDWTARNDLLAEFIAALNPEVAIALIRAARAALAGTKERDKSE